MGADEQEVEQIYPPLSKIRDVSAAIAVAVVEVAHNLGIATQPKPDDLLGHIRSRMCSTDYPKYVASAI